MNPDHQEFHADDTAVHVALAERDTTIARLRAQVATLTLERDEARAEAAKQKHRADNLNEVIRQDRGL